MSIHKSKVRLITVLAALVCFALLVFSGNSRAQRIPYGTFPSWGKELPPVIDKEDEPFDWYRYPLCILGVMGGPEETMITPEGYLRTDFGTLKFYTGPDLKPVNQRVKTLMEGYLPIVQTSFKQGGLDYEIISFAATIPRQLFFRGMSPVPYVHQFGLSPKTISCEIENMGNFVQVKVHNNSKKKKEAYFWVGMDFTHRMLRSGESVLREIRERKPEIPSEVYFDTHSGILRGDGVGFYLCSPLPTEMKGGKEHLIGYKYVLEPQEARKIVIKMPYFMMKERDFSVLRKADFDAYLKKTVRFWNALYAQGLVIEVPEKKVVDAYKASLMYLLIGGLDIVEGHYILNPAAHGYDDFYIRDAALNLRGLDLCGYNDIVGKCVCHILNWQHPDGCFANDDDGNGQGLFAIGHHYLVTRDKSWAKKFYPYVKKSMDWQKNYREKAWDEAEGLMAYTEFGDNELVCGHLVGHNLWALLGMKCAIEIAKGAGELETAEKWEKDYQQYHDIFVRKLKEVFKQEGFITPAFEGLRAKNHKGRIGTYGKYGGIDWGNLMIVYPSGELSPWDPMVSASLRHWRELYREGLFPYPQGGDENFLHAYTPTYISETYVIRGEQWEATRDLYGLLLHQTACHAAGEVINAPTRMGRGGRGDLCCPHCEHAGKLVTLLRDMLVREEGDVLHIASVLSPAWLKEGSIIKFLNGPTFFGKMSFTLKIFKNGFSLNLEPPRRNAPQKIVIHIPENMEIKEVKRDGKIWKDFSRREIKLPPETASLKVKWRKLHEAPVLSFKQTVEEYKESYKNLIKQARR